MGASGRDTAWRSSCRSSDQKMCACLEAVYELPRIEVESKISPACGVIRRDARHRVQLRIERRCRREVGRPVGVGPLVV